MRMKKLFMFLVVGIFIALIANYGGLLQTAAEDAPKILDIASFPEEVFMEFGNLKPGDKMIDDIEIRNNGNIDFEYLTTAEHSGGSERFYKEIILELKDQNSIVLFKGKLKDFKRVENRQLSAFAREKLLLTVSVPPELGNEYQGLSTGMILKFTAMGDGVPVDGKTNGSDGGILPDTGTDLYKILISGALLLVVGILLFLLINIKRRRVL